jgi:hypothetical protein
MVPATCASTAPVPSPSYQRAVARQPTALHLTALTLVTTLRSLDLCRLAMRAAHRRCPPPLPAGPGGAPRVYREESLLLIALLRTLWRLSYQDMHDWLVAWPALAEACGLPRDRRGHRRRLGRRLRRPSGRPRPIRRRRYDPRRDRHVQADRHDQPHGLVRPQVRRRPLRRLRRRHRPRPRRPRRRPLPHDALRQHRFRLPTR